MQLACEETTTASKWIHRIGSACLGLTIPFLLSGRTQFGVVLLMGFICGLLLLKFKQETSPYWRDLITSPIAIMALIATGFLALSCFTSVDPALSFSTWVRIIPLPLAILFSVYSLRNHLDNSVRFFLITAIIFLSFALFTIYLFPSYFHFIQLRSTHPRNFWTALKPVLNCLVIITPFACYYAFTHKQHLYRYIFALYTALLIFAVISSSAKASMVAFLALFSISVIAYILVSKRKIVKVLLICSLGALSLFLILWLPTLINESSQFNKDIAFVPTWLIDFHRQTIWHFSFNKFLDSPWLGYGLNASNLIPEAKMSLSQYLGSAYNAQDVLSVQVLPGHPHNWVLEIMLDTGLFGFIPFISLVMFIFWTNFRLYYRTKHPVLLAALGVNAAYWGSGLVNFSYWSSWWQTSYYLSIFFCVIVFFNSKYNLSNTEVKTEC